MAINGNIDGLKKDVIKNLSKDKLKRYIFYLTKQYFETYIANDEEAFNFNIELLNEVINEYREVYINLMGFVFFCLSLNANVVITKGTSGTSFKLANPFTYDLIEDEDFEDDLHHDMKIIFNKERVKERYYEKKISEFIE